VNKKYVEIVNWCDDLSSLEEEINKSIHSLYLNGNRLFDIKYEVDHSLEKYSALLIFEAIHKDEVKIQPVLRGGRYREGSERFESKEILGEATNKTIAYLKGKGATILKIVPRTFTADQLSNQVKDPWNIYSANILYFRDDTAEHYIDSFDKS